MQLVLLSALLFADPAEPAGYDSMAQAASAVAPQLQTGTLIFNEGDCLAIRIYSGGPYTHVAAVVVTDGQPLVYDSMNGIGVRKLSLEQYLASQAPERIHLFHPQQPLNGAQCETFAAHLEQRLGTPYSVLHHLGGERAEDGGVHCSEYVTDALMEIGVVHAERPANVSPASLVQGITEYGIYSDGVTIELERPKPPLDEDANWCQRMWYDTKLCCRSCKDKLVGWFLCR